MLRWRSCSKFNPLISICTRGLSTSPTLLQQPQPANNNLYFKELPNLNLNQDYVKRVTNEFLPSVRKLRLQRVRDMLKKYNCAAGIFYDPCHIRYACDASNMTIWHMRNNIRYLLVSANESDPTVLFESLFVDAKGIEPLIGETIDHWEPNISTTYCSQGDNLFDKIEKWADQMDTFLKPICRGAGNNNVAVQGGDPMQAFALEKKNYTLRSGQQVIERARSIKVENEVELIKCGIQSTADGTEHLRRGIVYGVSENELWSRLHEYNISVGGEYIETRLLNSGMRTSPWMQESSTKIIEPNDLIAFDADCTGPFGYFIDFSRTWHSAQGYDTDSLPCLDPKKLRKQRELHKYAKEQLAHNMDLCKPGITFREIAEKCWKIPERFLKRRYGLLGHGNGINGEYPYLYHDIDFDACGYDGVLEENMTISLEAFVAEDNMDGVKLEEHCLITENGIKNLSDMVPFCEILDQ